MTERNEELYWTAAYERHGIGLLAYLRRLSRDTSRAEELLHDVFERAMRSSRRPSIEELRSWLYRIATNLVIDDARRRRHFQFVPFLGDEPAPASNSDAAELVRLALGSISGDQGAALVLRLSEGFSRTEIAQMLGVSEETVKARLARGRKNFAAAYARLERGLAR